MKKRFRSVTSVLLAVLMVALMLTVGVVSVGASTGGRSQADAVNWANSKVGQALDYDGAYGAQCVDLIAYYYQYLGTSTLGGNACDYTWNSLPSGWSRISNYSGFVPQPGDICVWGSYANISSGYTLSQYGHVGIVTSGNASTFNSVEQNVSGQYTQTCSNRGTGYVTCFIRPDFVSDTSVPTISNARAENISGSSFTIMCDLYDDVNVTRVWLNIYGPNGTTNGYAVAASNGSFSHTIYTSDYAGAGLYSVHIYAFDAAGHETSTAVGNIHAINDTSAPTITNARAVNISGSEFTITCELNDNVNVTRVWLNIYGPNGTTNGYAVAASNGPFSHTIYTSDYAGAGLYSVHIYAFDAAGHETSTAVGNIQAINDTSAPTITNARAVNISGSEFSITCELNDNVNVTRVYVIVYSPNGAQNNGYDVPASNGTFSHTIKTAKYGGAGIYAIHLYAFDAAGNQAPCAINDIAAFQVAESVEISKTKTTINVGENDNLTATVLPSDTHDKSITWTSSNTNVATVDDGVVTGVSAGTAVITATTSNGKTATCTVTVNNPEPEKKIKDGVYYENGVAKNPGLVKVGNDIYCTTREGKLIYGDKEIYSSRTNGLLPPGVYHFDEVTGKLYKDNVIIDDVYYKEGAPKNVGIVKVAGSYYVTTTKGVITKDAYNKYIASSRTNGLVAIGYYDFGPDGKMILKNGIIGGKYYVNGKATNVGLFEYEADGVTNIYCTTTGGVIIKDVTNKFIASSRTNGLAKAGYYSFDSEGRMIK